MWPDTTWLPEIEHMDGAHLYLLKQAILEYFIVGLVSI